MDSPVLILDNGYSIRPSNAFIPMRAFHIIKSIDFRLLFDSKLNVYIHVKQIYAVDDNNHLSLDLQLSIITITAIGI